MNENNMEPRECEWCGKVFKPRRFWQKYCCENHKTAAWNKVKCDRLRKKPRNPWDEHFDY